MSEIRTDLFKQSLKDNEAVFAEPWQAQVFALTVSLHEAGVFPWTEWSQTLGAQIAALKSKGEEDYFSSWLNALEEIVIKHNLANATEVQELTAAWREAYRTTPHGKPVKLAATPSKFR